MRPASTERAPFGVTRPADKNDRILPRPVVERGHGYEPRDWWRSLCSRPGPRKVAGMCKDRRWRTSVNRIASCAAVARFRLLIAAGGLLSGTVACGSDDAHVAGQPSSTQSQQTCVGNESCPEGRYCQYPTGTCGMTGTGMCAVVPPFCRDYGQPTCGCDGVTYGNDCQPGLAHVNVLHDGSCEEAAGIVDR